LGSRILCVKPHISCRNWKWVQWHTSKKTS